MRIELHCHTVASWDGYTSLDDLVDECARKQIRAIAISEHDRFTITEDQRERARARGVELIPSAEVTTRRGTHIIGLFLHTMPRTGSGAEVIAAIRDQGGLVSIPHPFKPGSGVFGTGLDASEAEAIVASADFIELHNGGYDQSSQLSEIRAVATRYRLRCIAASDAHKPWHVGALLTEFPIEDGLSPDQLRSAMATASPTQLLRARDRAPRSSEPTSGSGRPVLLQRAIDQIPRRMKRAYHLGAYQLRRRGYVPEAVTYHPLD